MAVQFEVPIFGLTTLGKKISIGKTYRTIAAAHRVGGPIFFIDNTASGATYTFYDEEGDVITDIQVGDTPYAYTITGTPTKDKFYVYNESLATSKTWAYQQDGSWVYNSLGTGTAIGTGKTNTTTVLAADEGKYATVSNTIWKVISMLRSSVDEGCDDWFVPSKEEVDKLRIAVDRDGDPLVTWFTNNHIWSSSEASATHGWSWNYNAQSWGSNYKSNVYGVFGARAF